MARISPTELGPEACAFLDLIAYSEIGPKLLAKSDDGYDLLYGATITNPTRFSTYTRHPAIFVPIPHSTEKSTAAGRYQILFYIYQALATRLAVNDFEPVTQDRMAISLVGEKLGAMAALHAGDIEKVITLCSKTWASFPGADYPGQHMQKMDDLLKAYATALPFYTKANPEPANFGNVVAGIDSTAAKVS